MYSELIHTRCGDGIDILKGQTYIDGGDRGGFKVFSCSPDISQENYVDLPLLNKISAEKQTYQDPSFMDDAYLFFTPDIGKKYLVNFHPIHFDPNASTGKYPHRPGNFINQIYIGDFDNNYPYETFGDISVWSAQCQGENFYYENKPFPLEQHDTIFGTRGNISYADISEFISDGRTEVLQKAVAFIISQYSVEPEKRKYLVIKDENSRKIELWIAAIECAFSPRMASGLSFATRLDRFQNTNKYTVNLNGQYQTQINLQSPTQKLRYHAMIVGVDERDKTNYSQAKALLNSPFVVLDGKDKTFSFDFVTDNLYFNIITSFDEIHYCFCKEFLQMFDITQPTAAVFDLSSVFNSLVQAKSNKSAESLNSAITILNQYNLIKTPYLENLYLSIINDLPNFLKEDVTSILLILEWLNTISKIVEKPLGNEKYENDVCEAFIRSVFTHPQDKAISEFQKKLASYSVSDNTAKSIISDSSYSLFSKNKQNYSSEDCLALMKILAEYTANLSSDFSDPFIKIFSDSLDILYRHNDINTASEIVDIFYKQNPKAINTVLVKLAASSSDKNFIIFILKLIIRSNPEIIASENTLKRFYQYLSDRNLGSFFPVVLEYRASQITDYNNMDHFLDWVLSCDEFQNIDLSQIYTAFDKNLIISDYSAKKIAQRIQEKNPDTLVCLNSAHIYFLVVLDSNLKSDEMSEKLNTLISQGVPSIENEKYAKMLIERMGRNNISAEIFTVLLKAISQSKFFSLQLVKEALLSVDSHQNKFFTTTIETAAQLNSNNLFDAFANECAQYKQFNKKMSLIQKEIKSKNAQKYFMLIEKQAAKIHNEKQGDSLIKKLFSKFDH